jgi:hypothetical protein
VEKGTVVGGKVYSDCLVPEFIDAMNFELGSKSYEYSVKGLSLLCEILGDKFADNEQVQGWIPELKEWLISEI